MVFAATNIPAAPVGMAHHIWLLTGNQTVHAGVVPSSELGVAIFSTPEPHEHYRDVLIENNSARVMPNFRLGYEDLNDHDRLRDGTFVGHLFEANGGQLAINF